MECHIIWNKLSLQEWQLRFDKITRSNILQSYTYAQAICKTNKQHARWGLVVIDGQEAGLVQIIEASILWNLLHGVVLDRGPLWFDGFGGAAHIKIFFEEFNKCFPQRFGRKRRIIPEIEDGATAQAILKQAGLERVEAELGYQTLWWDFTSDDEVARGDLKRKWRGKVSKAERSGLIIEWDDKGAFYPWLRAVYAQDKKKRGYGGASPQLLDNLAAFSTPENPMIIGKASLNKEDIAVVMFLKHGRSATYQVGWSSEEGRNNNAHHLLLWQARTMLQGYGIQELDLGGINDDTAAGIKIFKEGTGATISKLVGHYH